MAEITITWTAPALYYMGDDGKCYRIDLPQPRPTGRATITADNRQKAIARALVEVAREVISDP